MSNSSSSRNDTCHAAVGTNPGTPHRRQNARIFRPKNPTRLAVLLILCNFSMVFGYAPPRISQRLGATTGTTSSAAHSPLFSRGRGTNSNVKSNDRRSSTKLGMVLTIPESIFEQASTQNLLDDLIDESVRTSARRPIIMQFDPSSGWIWRRWKGTVFSETWRSCVINMVYACAIYLIFRTYPRIVDYLTGFGTLWGQLLSVTTFTLTFFVNQAYALWRKCTQLSRRLQGRLHDIGLNCATHAARTTPASPDEPSGYTDASRQVLELMSRYVRLFNIMTYASFTRSHRPILTPRGMRRLVERGLMTAQEREVLVNAAIPATQRHSAILMWMMRLFIEAREAGHIGGGSGFEQQTIEKFHVIRSQYGAIGDELQGRMPLAYAHIVQVLVDVILWTYPIMALSNGMSPFLTVIGTGLLTTSYQGLFDLAKQFLDPYDNENYGKGEDPLSVDTLIAETNAGSVRWINGFEEMPFSAERLRDGDLKSSLLPVRGYSVEELAQMEEDERIRKEWELEEQRLEEQRLKEEAEKESVDEAAAAAAEAAENDDEASSDEDESTPDATEEDDAPGSDAESSPDDEVTIISDETKNETVIDEEIASIEDVIPDSLISREEYERQLSEAEREILETEAILNAAPGADSINWKEEEEEQQSQMGINLDILEMDVDGDDGLYVDIKSRTAPVGTYQSSEEKTIPKVDSDDVKVDAEQELEVKVSIDDRPSSVPHEITVETTLEDKASKDDDVVVPEVENASREKSSDHTKDETEEVTVEPSDDHANSTASALELEGGNSDDQGIPQSSDLGEDSPEVQGAKSTEVEYKRTLTEEEEEMLETQAILEAAPGLDSVIWKEEMERRALANMTMSETFDEDVSTDDEVVNAESSFIDEPSSEGESAAVFIKSEVGSNSTTAQDPLNIKLNGDRGDQNASVEIEGVGGSNEPLEASGRSIRSKKGKKKIAK